MSKLLVLCLPILAIFLAAPTVEGQPATVSFSTDEETYPNSLLAFRAALTRGYNESVFNIPLLPGLDDVTPQTRFMEISLTNVDVTVKLAIDVVNAYVFGYYTPNPKCEGFFFFNNYVAVDAMKYVFRNSGPQTKLRFDGSYGSLGGAGGQRESVTLGLDKLSHLLPALYKCRASSSKDFSDVAKALVIAIQVISEAARFQKIADAVPNNQIPNSETTSLENNWDALSKVVQQANTGQFNFTVYLQNATGDQVIVNNANSTYVIGNLKLLLKQKNRTTSPLPSVIH